MNMNLAKSALTERFTEFAPLSTAAADYDVVRRAIAHIRGNWRSQPEIDVIANAAGVSATDLHHLFRRWCGLTPKAFLQALTLNRARELLRSSASILDTAYEVGLSGPGRLHDLFVTHEAMSPGEWKAGGEGLTITYGFHPCPFGMALVMTTPRGLAGLALADAGKERAALKDMRTRWPRADYVEDFAATAATARRIFDPALWRKDQPLRVVLIGTDFEVRVWEKLLDIPMGAVTTYSDLAASRRGRRQKSDLLRDSVSPGHRQRRRPDRLPLGHNSKAGNARLGSWNVGSCVARPPDRASKPPWNRH
jgi:AraC family transcriptional regulator, regulatory protein of adaptative response / methylated-DNA-[protein]-cysteine methyltransferase